MLPSGGCSSLPLTCQGLGHPGGTADRPQCPSHAIACSHGPEACTSKAQRGCQKSEIRSHQPLVPRRTCRANMALVEANECAGRLHPAAARPQLCTPNATSRASHGITRSLERVRGTRGAPLRPRAVWGRARDPCVPRDSLDLSPTRGRASRAWTSPLVSVHKHACLFGNISVQSRVGGQRGKAWLTRPNRISDLSRSNQLRPVGLY